MDSLDADVIEIGHIIMPDCCQCRQEAPKRDLATPASFLLFLSDLRDGGGAGVSQRGEYAIMALDHALNMHGT